MDRDEFWRLIEEAKEESDRDYERQVDILSKKLAAFPPEQIVEFKRNLDEVMALSYTNDLWAACYIINGGCSDDGFDYFRGWLITQGRAIFEDALKDPETLVDIAESDVECERMIHLPVWVYEEKTGTKMPRPDLPSIDLTGEEWDEDSLETKYPKLAAKFFSQDTENTDSKFEKLWEEYSRDASSWDGNK